MNRLSEGDKQRLRVRLCDMKRRCYEPSHKFYKDYGARGITVCDEWLDKKYGHENFRKWATINGYKNGLSIDRIDNNLGYYPDNCRWATAKQQANNRRTNNLITINKVNKSVTEWAELFGFDSDLAIRRYNKGLSVDEIFIIPKNSTKKRKVIRLNDLKLYDSLHDAARDIGGWADKISLVCRGKRKSHKNYKFVFEEDYNDK